MAAIQNPLSSATDVTVKHVIVAFQYSSDASVAKLHSEVGRTGETAEVEAQCGKGIVVINEFKDNTFSLLSAETSWNFFSPVTPTTTSYIGQITITDRAGGLFLEMLKEWSERLGVSIGQLAFSWQPFFVCKTPFGAEVISCNQLVFNVTDLSQVLSDTDGRIYCLSIQAVYNTIGQMPQFNKLYQTTVTHADSNLHNEIPKPEGASGGIIPRGVEDGMKSPIRQRRIDKSKVMKTLKDLFSAFKKELDEQKHLHKRQLQEWLHEVRNGYVKKITTPTETETPVLEYDVDLDSVYSGYSVDNRNLPFEQPEQDQRKMGVRSLTLPHGSCIQTAVDSFMEMSKKVGDDYALTPVPKIHKSNTSVIRKCDGKYHVKLKVRQIDAPVNTVYGTDSGPGNNVLAGPLEYKFQDSDYTDSDIISIKYKSNVDWKLGNVESQEDGAEASVVYGNRESQTVERVPNEPFFASGFSGVRAQYPTRLDIVGLEKPETVTNILNYRPRQNNYYEVTIRGNPWLLNDINVNPLDAESDSYTVGTYQLYTKMDYEPTYVRLELMIDPASAYGLLKLPSAPEKFYYDGFLHVFRITNRFFGGEFYQILELYRTDEVM